MARIIVISASESESSLVLDCLRESDHAVRHVLFSSNIEHDLAELESCSPEIVVMDSVGAEPDSDYLQALREAIVVPLLVLLPGYSELSVVRVLRLGADDCIIKPIYCAEFLARVDAHYRRFWQWQAQDSEETALPLVINDLALSVVVEDREIKLTPTEHRLLMLLAEREGSVVTRKELGHMLWGTSESKSHTSTLNLYIHHLRDKIERDPHRPRHILTKWGVGYYLVRDPVD